MAGRTFEPINIGPLRLPNRWVMPAIGSNYGDSSGHVTQRLIDHYVERAKNEVGLVIIEVTCVALGGKVIVNELCVYDDSYIPGLKKLADAIHAQGAKTLLQLHHGGRRAYSKMNNGVQPVAPSAIPTRTGEMPRAMSLEEIDSMVGCYASAAARAREAGFDGVECHFAHGYLIAQFLSPLTNKRTDKYGGDVIARGRIALEIVERIRRRVGKDFPVTARICGDEYIKGGLTLRDTQKFAAILEQAGVNAISVSAGYTASSEEGYLNALLPFSFAPMPIPHGCYLHLAEGIKKMVNVPVIAVGRLDDVSIAEKALADGRADMIAVGRALLADPAFVAKVKKGQLGGIRKCMACGECSAIPLFQATLLCAVNPELGKDAEYRITPAPRPKKVLVIGGGPGGMETARIAALRGHRVTLADRRPYLGGNMVPAAAPSFKNDIGTFTEYLAGQLGELKVDIKLGKEFTAQDILAFKPDAVVLATGASPAVPPIPGAEGSNVTTAIKVLEEKFPTGQRVVVAGAGAVGCETAAYLAQQGKEVTVVEMRNTDFSDSDGLAPDMSPIMRRWFLFELLPTLPIEVIGKSMFKEVTDKGLIVQDREGKVSLVPGDTIVFAAGMKSNNSLKAELEGKVPELYEVGDCLKPRHIIDAVADAARVARQI